MVNIPMCYSNSTIVNMYWHYSKLVYKIIVNGSGYRITYFVAGYWIASLSLSLYIYIYIYIYIHIYIYIGRGYSAAGYKISYSVATSIYHNFIY